MREQFAEPPADVRVAALAERQHGIVSYAQLQDMGLDKSAIERRVRRGGLHRVRRGVYAVGHARLTQEGRFLSAVLAYGDRAVLSHNSAAVLWRMRPAKGPRVDVTVPSGGTRARRGAVIVHRSPLPDEDVTVRDSIPVTTPGRTLVDIADCSTRRELERAIDEALYLGLDLSSVQPFPGRRGAGLLASVLNEHAPGTTRTRSDFEEVLLALCREYGLPEPLVNQRIEGYEVDFVWPDARVIVETDSWSAHGRRSTFESDRLRDAALQVAGWRVIRITWRRVTREPEAVAAQLGALIGVQLRA
jgi:very-short-patch-repair endonuclease